MQTPLEIHATDFPLTDAMQQEIGLRVAKLEEGFGTLIKCRVGLGGPSSHHRKGGPFSVCIDVTVPGHQLVTKREHADLYMAIREACRATRRQLLNYAQRRRRQTKLHVHHPHGRVTRLIDDHGFLTTADGREIYFHRNSLLDTDFDGLKVGTDVSYVERSGDKGPHASTVMRVGGPALPEEIVAPT